MKLEPHQIRTLIRETVERAIEDGCNDFVPEAVRDALRDFLPGALRAALIELKRENGDKSA